MNKKIQTPIRGGIPDNDAAMASASSAPSSSVQAVGMAFAVLEELAQSRDPLGPSELARRLGQTKARVHRHLLTLKELGFVDQDSDTSQYRLGWKSYRLSAWCNENFNLRDLARRHMQALYRKTGQTALLSMPAGNQITVAETIESPDNVTITVRPGSVIATENSALGRSILAFQRDRTRHPPELAKELARVRKQWWAVAANERLPGVAALGAPIFDDRNQPVAAIGLIASDTVITVPPPPNLVRQVQETAMQISRELNSTAWEEFFSAAEDDGFPGRSAGR